MKVEGVGDIVAESIVGWFADTDNQKPVDKFKKVGVKPIYKSKVRGPLHNKNFAITGSLESMSRDIAAEKIRALGGTFQSSVGNDTDFLVVGANVGENKLTKAKKLGTKQIKENELIKILKN
jgi:DNA ligase (NAD+)